MAFAPKKVVVIGATSGIGEAAASRLAKAGSAVIVTGRRQDRLQQFISAHADAAKPVKSYTLDLTKTDTIASWVQKVTAENPDIDSVIINSGLQRLMNLTKPAEIDWPAFHEETTVNYVSHVILGMAFLEFFQKQHTQSSIIFMSSGLALTPLPRVPSYSASKAAAHHFVLALRHQLKDEPKIKVIEVIPPMVATELHNQQGEAGKYGRAFGMPLDNFINDMFTGLDAGKDQIPVGMVIPNFEGFEIKRQEAMEKMAMGVVGMQKKLADSTK